MTTWYSRDDAAERAGVEAPYLSRLVDLGILTPDEPDRFSGGDVRRVLMASRSRMPGSRSTLWRPPSERGAAVARLPRRAPPTSGSPPLSAETFRQVSDRTGIPLELLTVIREAIGMARPSPDDRLREDEVAIVPFIELQLAEGFRPTAIERLLRVQGDSTRRITEQEAAWWRSEVIEPGLAAGKSRGGDRERRVRRSDLAARRSRPCWPCTTRNRRVPGRRTSSTASSMLMAKAGIHSRLERLPAICFLDITGYTRLTQERGDDAAADLASTVARLVQRTSVQHGGKPIKWLGDGVMFHFDDPGPGVRAALEMVSALATAGLPPAHVGLHAGPVLFQEGDYFGQTVNLSARIADYARPGEVLVSAAVADASDERRPPIRRHRIRGSQRRVGSRCTCCAPSSYEPGHLASRSHGALVGRVHQAEPAELAFYRAAIERFGEPALDLACGAGRLLVPLLEAGLDVDGVDVSPDMLAQAQRLAAAQGMHPTLTPQAIRELDLPRHYRTIFICDSFGIGGPRADDLEGLRRIYAHLEPGGALVFSHHLPYGDEESEWLRWLPHRHGETESWPETGDRRRAADGDELELLFRERSWDPLLQRSILEVRSTAVARRPPRARGRARRSSSRPTSRKRS